MSQSQSLADVAARITSKKSRYARCVDRKEWETFAREVVLPDCRWEIQDTNGKSLMFDGKPMTWASTADYLVWFPKMLERMDSVHMFGPGDIELVSPDTVKAVFPHEDQCVSKDLGAWVEFRGGGYMYETWKLVDGDWFLQEAVVKRCYQKTSMLVKFFVFLQETLGIKTMG